MHIDFVHVNYLAVIVAAASAFMLGGLWYSKALFGEVWNRESGQRVSETKKRHPSVVFGVSYLLSFASALVFAAFLPDQTTLSEATLFGLIIGMAWVATSFGINYGFGSRSLTLWAIDAGYHTLQFTLYGLILGAWRPAVPQ